MNMIKQQNEVALEILRQLGNNKFLAMTGANNLTYDKNSLSFKLGGRGKITHINIMLNVFDTYDITFYKIVKNEIKFKETVINVYSDQLQDVFVRHTGIAIRL